MVPPAGALAALPATGYTAVDVLRARPGPPAEPDAEDQAPPDDAVPPGAVGLQPVPAPPLQRAQAALPAPGVHRGPLHRHRGLPGAARGRGRPAGRAAGLRAEAAAAG